MAVEDKPLSDISFSFRPDITWWRPDLRTALEWYGLGGGGQTGATVYFIGRMGSWRPYGLQVVPLRFSASGESEVVGTVMHELPLEQVWYAAMNSVSVLVRVPVVFVTIFDLAAFILSPEELAEAERRVREYNTTFLPPSSDKPAETLGSIRV